MKHLQEWFQLPGIFEHTHQINYFTFEEKVGSFGLLALPKAVVF